MFLKNLPAGPNSLPKQDLSLYDYYYCLFSCPCYKIADLSFHNVELPLNLVPVNMACFEFELPSSFARQKSLHYATALSTVMSLWVKGHFTSTMALLSTNPSGEAPRIPEMVGHSPELCTFFLHCRFESLNSFFFIADGFDPWNVILTQLF